MPKTHEEVVADLHKLAGAEFPVTVQGSPDGGIASVTYEKQWKTGGTTPVKDEAGVVTGYDEHYEQRELSAEQVKQVDDYIEKLTQ